MLTALVLTSTLSAGASAEEMQKSRPGKKEFPIGIFWPPSPQDTTDEKYAELKNMNVNFIVGGNGLETRESNLAALQLAAKYDIGLLAADLRFHMKNDHEALIEETVRDYRGQEGLIGYHLLDEPFALKLAHTDYLSQLLKKNDPEHLVYVNLNPIYANAHVLQLDQYAGTYITPDQPIGQTFRTTAEQTSISTVQFYIDLNQWSEDEQLTLTLWDSRARNSKIAENTQGKPAGRYSVFTLNAPVNPNSTYYMELTHNGGGDQSIGWIVHSNIGDNWLQGGTAYKGDVPLDADLWFTFDQAIEPITYEDYVYRWARTKPGVLSFDHYPFLYNGDMRGDYYANLEVIRRQALAAGIDFWTYIQSIGITDVYRQPNEQELRYQIYTSLTYGAKGYMYFTYWTPKPGVERFYDGIILRDGTRNESYEWARKINAEVLNLGPVLLGLTSEAVYHTGELPLSTTALPDDFCIQPEDKQKPLVIGAFTNKKDRRYVMLVNRNYQQELTMSFHVAGNLKSVKEISKETGEETVADYDASTGLLTVSFEPGEGRLFVLPKDE